MEIFCLHHFFGFKQTRSLFPPLFARDFEQKFVCQQIFFDNFPFSTTALSTFCINTFIYSGKRPWNDVGQFWQTSTMMDSYFIHLFISLSQRVSKRPLVSMIYLFMDLHKYCTYIPVGRLATSQSVRRKFAFPM